MLMNNYKSSDIKMNERIIGKISTSINTTDGEGVKIKRSIGSGEIGIRNDELSPFLLLDEIRSNESSDYMSGFPIHPHRGFITVTYMLKGEMRHTDNRGNQGLLKEGSAQFMVAGRGIVHSEMPIRNYEDQSFFAFQLWINLPSAKKMVDPSYQDYHSTEIPTIFDTDTHFNNYAVKVLAGQFKDTIGPIVDEILKTFFFDIELKPNTKFTDIIIPSTHNAFVYVYNGNGRFGGPASRSKIVKINQVALFLNNGGDENSLDTIQVEAGSDGVKFLLLAALPIHNEKVVQYGPFVMNSDAEIKKAILDFRTNNF
ncbi:hypothetical protein ACTFIY_001841 [Dictyostelium cf. discoideum]